MSETAIFITFVALHILNVLLAIAFTREPYSPAYAITSIFMSALILWGIYILWVN